MKMKKQSIKDLRKKQVQIIEETGQKQVKGGNGETGGEVIVDDIIGF